MGVKEAVAYAKTHARESGWTEHPAGSNHTHCWDAYGKIYGVEYQGQPWCGASNCVVCYHGGWTAPGQFISVLALYNWGVANKRFHRVQSAADLQNKAGDLLIIGSPSEHEEFALEDAHGGTVLSHGGNTSPGTEGSQYNGGTEAIKTRYWSEIYGYVTTHDLLDGGKTPPPPKHDPQPQYRKESKTGPLHLWETGPRVEQLQNWLGINADGYYGRNTASHVEAFKKKHKDSLDNTDGNYAGQPLFDLLQHTVPTRPKAPTLRKGDTGGMVRKLQRKLNEHLGGDDIKANGVFGDYTEEAVKRVQKRIGVEPTGVADAHVWEYLLK